MTAEQLIQIMPLNWVAKPRMDQEAITKRKLEVANTYLPYLKEYMEAYGINTKNRQAMFIAQIAHECGELRYTREIWGPTAAQKGYEGRKDLGNTSQGDGKRFMGRGLIQITGRANYAKCSQALIGTPSTFLDTPDLLSTPRYAVETACWFWANKGLNALADTGNFLAVTKKINGGTNGLAERQHYWERAKNILS